MKAAFVFACLLLLTASVSLAKEVTFKGASVAGLNLNLLNATLWEGELVPASGDDIIFPGTSEYVVSFDNWDTIDVGSITIGGSDLGMRQRLIIFSTVPLQRGITILQGGVIELHNNTDLLNLGTNQDAVIVVGNLGTLSMNETDGIANVSLPIRVNSTGALLLVDGMLDLMRPLNMSNNANCSIADSSLLIIRPDNDTSNTDIVLNTTCSGNGRILLETNADMVWNKGNCTVQIDITRNASLTILTDELKSFNNTMNVNGTLVINGTLWMSDDGTIHLITGNATLIGGSHIQWDNTTRNADESQHPLILISGGNWTSHSNTSVLVPFRNERGNVTILNLGTIAEPGTAAFLSQVDSFVQLNGKTVLLKGAILAIEQMLDIRGGELAGNGTIVASRVVINGTLSPGFSPDLLVINGDLVMTDQSVLLLDIQGEDDNLHDRVWVNGNVDIQGGTLRVITPTGLAATGNNITVILVTSSTGTLTGNFTTIDNTNSAVNVTSEASEDALVVVLQPTPLATTTGGVPPPGGATTGAATTTTTGATTTGQKEEEQGSAAHFVVSWGVVILVILGMIL